MDGYMAKQPPILAGDLSTCDAFRSQSGFTPTGRETVFLTISRVNGCTYCKAAHSMITDRKSGVPSDRLAAMRAGEPLSDARLQAITAFTRAMVVSCGNAGCGVVDAFLAAGYGEKRCRPGRRRLSNLMLSHRDGPSFVIFSGKLVVPRAGIEPATRGFSIRCSTN
jgi:AhpD family alkylhydroperoxidase